MREVQHLQKRRKRGDSEEYWIGVAIDIIGTKSEDCRAFATDVSSCALVDFQSLENDISYGIYMNLGRRS